jgi:hypothetical protein
MKSISCFRLMQAKLKGRPEKIIPNEAGLRPGEMYCQSRRVA